MRCRQVVYMFQNVYACKFNVCYYVFSYLIVVLDCFQAFFASIYFLDFNTAVGIPLLQSNRVAFISNVTMITSFLKPLIYYKHSIQDQKLQYYVKRQKLNVFLQELIFIVSMDLFLIYYLKFNIHLTHNSLDPS